MYLLTLAPGVTFWDAGEFIAAAHGFGIPHPPGTPLYVAIGRCSIMAAGWLLGEARAMNLLSALCTAAAGALTAALVARETAPRRSAPGAVMAGMLAGLMCTAWSNATETEVYALALLHVVVMLTCASRVADSPRGERWLALTAYVMALAPAVHLSALVGAPAAIALAARNREGTWSWRRALLLTGVLVASAGAGRVSPVLTGIALVLMVAGVIAQADTTRSARETRLPLLLVPLAVSAILIMLVRARHDPAINQGNPSTIGALLDVVGRRQYAVAGLFPRQAPVWLQAANVAQYADWQFAMGWGQGIFTSVARVAVTFAYVALGIVGWREMRRSAPRLASTLLVLVVCGTAGVAAYLNLKAGASLGWGVLPDTTPHEARERDYFFVLGFWGWGCLAGWGSLALAERVGRRWLALAALAIPLAANWTAVDRAHGPDAGAARRVAVELLRDVPPGGVLFTSGDNDSYPLWYLQAVERVRPDVQLVTLPLLAALWYPAEIGRRTGWRWNEGAPVPGAKWIHEQTASAIARAAIAAGHPVVASPALALRERALVGSGWILRGTVYVATAPANAGSPAPTVDSAAARTWRSTHPNMATPGRRLPDDVSAEMLRLLECPRLGLAWAGTAAGRDSLEVSCNFR